MRSLLWPLIVAGVFGTTTLSGHATTREEFKAVYDALQRQVLDRSGEVAEIDSFTYVKDVATFRFGKGVMLLQRPVNGRPTVAAYVGKGHVHVDIPPRIEMEAYRGLTGDTSVDEDFQVCFMRISDDFDLQIKSAAAFGAGSMGTAEFSKVRDAQSEYYFKPTLYNLYDNLAQLAVSTFERNADGYFWAGFNDKVFAFDPNRAEEVNIAYSSGPWVTLSDLGPKFQRKQRSRHEVDRMSELDYQVTVTAQDALLEMGGADGWSIQKAEIRTLLTVNADSLRFVRLFLDKHFEPDSIWCNGATVDWFRRYQFFHLEILLPEYARKGDHLTITLWFHDAGDRYAVILPFVDDPSVFPSTIHLVYPRGYSYAVPARQDLPVLADGRGQCKAGPLNSRELWFVPLPTGFDTTRQLVNQQLSLIFIRRKNDDYLRGKAEDTTVDACEYFSKYLGIPSGMSEWHVLPGSQGSSLGMFGVPLTKGERHAGGIHGVASRAAASAWFGPMFQPASYRERWMLQAVPRYLSILYAQKRTGNAVLYGELDVCRTIILVAKDYKTEVPLAIGDRVNADYAMGRGVWLLHMLRLLMFDLQGMNDDKFLAFLKDVIIQANQQKFSNTDFCRLAEQHFGGPLDWFFDPWLYKKGLPTFAGTWKQVKESDGHYVDLHVETTGVDTENVYVVLLKAVLPGGSGLLRQVVSGSQQDYRIGPFPEAPTDLKFNEYESVLCKAKMRKI